MTRQNFSSGDLIADRRADYARMMAEAGDHRAAADLMRQALELAPDWAAGWFALASHCEKTGDAQDAIEAYARTLALSPDDVYGAQMKLAALGSMPPPAAPPRDYVERLFDDYAERFEAALVERLNYRIPELLSRMIFRNCDERFRRAVDLGCGTGLLGEHLRDRVSRLEGYDLSRNMLAKAAEKQIYDHLGQADLVAPCDRGGLPAPKADGERADLLTAADVFMYFGDLDPVFANVAAIARPGAFFAFSVEKGGEDEGWVLQPSLRYRHGPGYVRALCARHGLVVVATETAVIRKDGDRDIVGLLTLARFAEASRRHAAATAALDVEDRALGERPSPS
jgi:predicted TPR repeat methyltransferase